MDEKNTNNPMDSKSAQDKFSVRTPLGGVKSYESKEEFIKQARDDAYDMVKIAGASTEMQDPYPSPYLSLSDSKLPEDMRSILKWCRYFYMFDPIIGGAVNKQAVFPITEIFVEKPASSIKGEELTPAQAKIMDDMTEDYKRIMFKTLNIYRLLIEIGIDYFLYGNCFVMGDMRTNKETDKIEWKYMIRLPVDSVIIDKNPATNEVKYKWIVPKKIKKLCRDKTPKAEYEKVPEIIRQAVNKNETVILDPGKIYHFAGSSDSMTGSSWGIPKIVHVLKLLMYRNILRQAQEAIAREHIVPFRIYYFQRTENSDLNTDFNKAAREFLEELKKSSRDPNYKTVSPVPVGVIDLGGQGRSLLLTPEIEQVQGEILAGLNLPREFVFGGVSYSGSSIALKILENDFITYRLLLKDFLNNFVIRNLAKARGEWSRYSDDDSIPSVHLSDLKMQDDVQHKQLAINLNSAGKVSDEYMYNVMEIDSARMKKQLEQERIEQVRVETMIQIENVKAQTLIAIESARQRVELQRALRQIQMENPDTIVDQSAMYQDPQMQAQGQGYQEQIPPEEEQVPPEGAQVPPEGAQVPPEGAQAEVQALQQQAGAIPGEDDGTKHLKIQKLAIQLMKMGQTQRDAVLSHVPESTRQYVLGMISDMSSAGPSGIPEEQSGIDMRPMPQQLPPRRDSVK